MQEKNDRKEDDRMKFRKLLLFTAVLLLVLSAGMACALELSADEIVPFGQNTVIVRSDTAGHLTLTPSLPDYDLTGTGSAGSVSRCRRES